MTCWQHADSGKSWLVDVSGQSFNYCWHLLTTPEAKKIPFPGRSSSHLLSLKDIRHIIRHNYRIFFLDSHQIIHIQCICALPNHCPFSQTKQFTSFPILTKSNGMFWVFIFSPSWWWKTNEWISTVSGHQCLIYILPRLPPEVLAVAYGYSFHSAAHGDKIEGSTLQTDKEPLL